MMPLKKQAANALKVAALNEESKKYVLENPILFNLFSKAAKRYIGGENIKQCIKTVKGINAEGIKATIDYMGERVRSRAEADLVTAEFLNVIEEIKNRELNATVSLDLSHIGLSIDTQYAYTNLNKLAAAVKGTEIEIMISAEDVEQTDKIVKDIFCEISHTSPNIGLTLQAYLYRTPMDLEHIIAKTQGKIRIVKGAFATPLGQSIERSEKLDNVYCRLVETLLINKRKCSIATHDEKIQQRLKHFVVDYSIPKDQYEFEMLTGIREDLLRNLKRGGHPCRQYVVYGKEWYLHLCNRISENPDNIFQAIVDIMS